MLKQLFEYVHKLLFLAHEVQQNRDELDKLRRSVEELAETVRQQSFDIQRISEREQHEREKFVLKIENALLRFERQLPSGKEPNRHDHLVVVTADGVHVKPWRIFNEKMTDNEELAVWEERVNHTNSTWRLRNGEHLPQGHHPRSVSAEWIAFTARDRRPWLAKLDTPTIVAAELPESSNEIKIFANGQTVHVFARRGWRNAEGPMKYLVYDFTRGAQPITEMTLPWARVVWDMDPEMGIAIVNDNNNFWGRIWLLELKTGKRKAISADWPSLIVKKEVAQKWIELAKP